MRERPYQTLNHCNRISKTRGHKFSKTITLVKLLEDVHDHLLMILTWHKMNHLIPDDVCTTRKAGFNGGETPPNTTYMGRWIS